MKAVPSLSCIRHNIPGGISSDALIAYTSVGLLRCRPTIDGQCEKPRSVGRQYIQIPTLFLYNFLRFVDNKMVGMISQSVKWPKNKKINQECKLVSDGSTISFYVDDLEILKVKYMPLDYAGVGFYTFGKQTLVVDDITFTQK